MGEAGRREWDGTPGAPERSGWHWIEAGGVVHALLWRGADWPEPLDRGTWYDGHAPLTPNQVCHHRYHGRYQGPVAMPPKVASLFRLALLFGQLWL